MRAVKVKALRKLVYGEMSHRTREYLKGHEPRQTRRVDGPNGSYFLPNPTCICTGLRRKYQAAKHA
jgi:hypothetical protein